MLLMGAELLNFLHHGPEQPMSGQFAAPVQCLDQTLLPELFSRDIAGFCDAVGIEQRACLRGGVGIPLRAVPMLRIDPERWRWSEAFPDVPS